MKWFITGIVIFILSVTSLIAKDQQAVKELPSIWSISFSSNERCYEGVVYLKLDRGVTVKLNRDGKVEYCTVRK